MRSHLRSPGPSRPFALHQCLPYPALRARSWLPRQPPSRHSPLCRRPGRSESSRAPSRNRHTRLPKTACPLSFGELLRPGGPVMLVPHGIRGCLRGSVPLSLDVLVRRCRRAASPRAPRRSLEAVMICAPSAPSRGTGTRSLHESSRLDALMSAMCAAETASIASAWTSASVEHRGPPVETAVCAAAPAVETACRCPSAHCWCSLTSSGSKAARAARSCRPTKAPSHRRAPSALLRSCRSQP